MAINYTKMASVAEALIAANGADCTFVRNSRDPADPTKPWRSPLTTTGQADSPVSITVTAVVVPIDEDDDKLGVRRGDSVAFVAANTFGAGSPFAEAAMEGFDFMTDSMGVEWKVDKVEILAPGPTRVAYMIKLLH